MKVLFFNPEQYLDYENEPSNYELRLPILNCGLVTAHRDYIYQRVLRSEGRDAMNMGALQEVLEFKPDLVVYSTSWPHESLDPYILREIMRRGILVFTHVWDTHIEPQPHEMIWFLNCNYFGVADSVTNYLHYRSLAQIASGVRGVLFTAGNIVFTDMIRKKDLEKNYDVTIIGSNEGQRVQLIQYLREKLAIHGITPHKFGGLVDSTKGTPLQGLTDQWVPIGKYVDIINQSKICLSSQTAPFRNQIKGKVFHYLACGTFCLSDSNSELRRIVPDGCIVYYDDFEDCLDKIVYYVNNEDERKRIADAGHRWFYETFDYRAFWSRFLEAVINGTVTLPNVFEQIWGAQNPYMLFQRAAIIRQDRLASVSECVRSERRKRLVEGKTTAQIPAVTVHKRNERANCPKVSIILLDWSVRERFHALDWLSRQNVPREQYELIWVELYDRVVPEVMEKADVVITCGQKGMYHKHAGYNVGLMHSEGQVITICDSDAVFPPDFIASIIKTFRIAESSDPLSLVLMHYEWRTEHTYPEKLSDVSQLSQYEWADLWPNVGACMSVRRIDAIRFGGFDEHPSFRGHICGPYDLGWRLVNVGIPEVWHDESVALWHFAHPNPLGASGQSFSWKLWLQVAYPHVQVHALTAVEAFSTGRLLPLKENLEVHKLRMSLRRIGTSLEEKYAWMTDSTGFLKRDRLKLHLWRILEPIYSISRKFLLGALKKWVGPQKYDDIRAWWHSLRGKKSSLVREGDNR